MALVPFELTRKRRKKVFWIIQITIWTLFFYYNIQFIHNYSMYTTSATSKKLIYILYLFIFSYTAIPLTLVLRGLIRKYRRKFHFTPLIAMVIGSTLVLANVWFLEVILLDYIASLYNIEITPYTLQYYLWEVSSAFLVLLSWGAFYLFTKIWEDWNEQRIITERALLLAENAQLKMLRLQLNPHFLFNSLGSLRALIRSDKDKALVMLTKISDFLRYSLTYKSEMEVTFSEELNAVRDYFDIEKVRFDDKLVVSYHIDPMAEDIPVPPFIIHPIIENAIKHGMNTSSMPLRIHIEATVENKKLTIGVSNTGKWIDRKENNNGTGTGISNVKSRLQTLYPDRSRIYAEMESGLVRVIIEIEHTKVKNDNEI